MDDALTLDRLLDAGPPASTALARGPALVDDRRRWTRAELRAEATALAGGLARAGAGPGDVVAWQLPNWGEVVVLFRACWRLGAVAAPLHHRHGEREIAGQLARLGPRVVLVAPGTAAAAMGEAASVVEVRGDGGYEELLATGGARMPGGQTVPSPSGRGAAPDDPAVVLFTSGATGPSKGVVHTHRSLGHKATTMPAVHGLGPADVVLMPAPLAHISGLLNGVLVPGVAGMAAVLMERWEPDRALELIGREQVSFMVGPPTFFRDLLAARSLGPGRVASLRIVSCGGAGVTPAFVEEASRRLGARVKRSYGSTEAPTVTTWHDGDPPERAATTDGRAVGGVEIRVVDSRRVEPGGGMPLPPGRVGEVQLRGEDLFAGYLGADPAAAFTPGGWFPTGDLGTLDADGWLTVLGRRGDLIIRGGENIAPAEVEALLESHPAIQRAVSVGLPDDRLGEVVGAAVVADRPVDAASCRDWFAELGVAPFKAPAVVVTVPELPTLGTGKPDRQGVRTLLLAAAQDPAHGDGGIPGSIGAPTPAGHPDPAPEAGQAGP